MMKLAIVSALVGSAVAFAPSMQGVRSTALNYEVKVFSEAEGIDAKFECDGETFIVGEYRLGHRAWSPDCWDCEIFDTDAMLINLCSPRPSVDYRAP